MTGRLKRMERAEGGGYKYVSRTAFFGGCSIDDVSGKQQPDRSSLLFLVLSCLLSCCGGYDYVSRTAFFGGCSIDDVNGCDTFCVLLAIACSIAGCCDVFW
jgi:hypothetical protein